MYTLLFSKKAIKHKALLKQARLDGKVKALLEVIKENPYKNPPSYEKLVGDFSGMYSRRINNQHRLVYKVSEEKKQVAVLSMWTHYEEL